MIEFDPEEITCEKAFQMVSDRFLIALMMHNEISIVFDFLGLRGFKRLHEYRFFDESINYKKVIRYYINHHNKMLKDNIKHEDVLKIIPEDWLKYTRFDVTPQVRSKEVSTLFEDWRKWETETKYLYEKIAKALMNKGMVNDANYISCLAKDTDLELKYLERMYLELKAVNFDEIYIIEIQNEMHDCYKEKLKDLDFF